MKKAENVDHIKITKDDFKDAVKDVLLSKTKNRPKSENRMPTKKELNEKFKLVKEKI